MHGHALTLARTHASTKAHRHTGTQAQTQIRRHRHRDTQTHRQRHADSPHQHVGGPQVAVRQAQPVQVPQPRRPARRVPVSEKKKGDEGACACAHVHARPCARVRVRFISVRARCTRAARVEPGQSPRRGSGLLRMLHRKGPWRSRCAAAGGGGGAAAASYAAAATTVCGRGSRRRAASEDAPARGPWRSRYAVAENGFIAMKMAGTGRRCSSGGRRSCAGGRRRSRRRRAPSARTAAPPAAPAPGICRTIIIYFYVVAAVLYERAQPPLPRTAHLRQRPCKPCPASREVSVSAAPVSASVIGECGERSFRLRCPCLCLGHWRMWGAKFPSPLPLSLPRSLENVGSGA